MLSHGDTKQHAADPGVGRGVLHDGDGRVRSGRALPDARVRDERPRPRHEHLDVADRSRTRSSRSIAASVLDEATLQADSAEWGRYRDVDGDGIPYRTVPATACRRTSRAARATTRRRSTASAPTTTSTTWIGWRGSSRRRSTIVPKPVVEDVAGAEVGDHRLRHEPLGDRREPRPARARGGLPDRLLPAARLSVHATSSTAFIDRTTRIYVVEQNRDAQMLQLMRLELDAERVAKLRSVLHYNGLPIDARAITDEILAQEGIESPTRHRESWPR